MAALLPLIPSAHSSAYTAEDISDGREDERATILACDKHTCRFCACTASSWQDVFHLDGDHANWRRDNVVTACPLCRSAQHLHRPTVEHELVVIWLPEISQAALNHIIRAVHLTLYRHGQPAYPKPWLRIGGPEARAAHDTFTALRAQSLEAERRIGSSSPRDLAAALQAMPAEDAPARARRLGGLRLLHLGRYMQRGEDRYPKMLEAWDRPAS